MKRVVALAVGLVLSTLLLGGGWLWSSLREREGRLREARARVSRSAEAVRAAVDESLEELRAREDERPFYLYNHFYSPPDVLAIADPVALSPLAHPPTDGRIVGHFQIDPGDVVRTPYASDGALPPLARRVMGAIEGDAFSSMRALAAGEAHARTLLRAEARLLGALDARDADGEGAEEALTIALNQWSNAQAQTYARAQSGDSSANAVLVERGRQVPNISRRDVGWSELEAEQRSARSAQQRSSSSSVVGRLAASPARVRTALEALRPRVLACTESSEIVVRAEVRGADGRATSVAVRGPETPAERTCVSAVVRELAVPPFGATSAIVRYAFSLMPSAASGDLEVTDGDGLDNMVRREAEVTYTPMVYREVDGALVLHRVVSHEGVSVVQGLLLDREHLVERWVPSIVERHTDVAPRPRVVGAGRGACAMRAPVSAVLSSLELCFAPAALRATTAALDGELRWQIGGLAALWSIALLAAAAIVSAARRAEALSRQKSAFVSAVSHELRTPLTTLRMHAEMLDEDLVSEERRPKVHRELVRESVRLARLVDNVLSLSKLEEGQRRLHRVEADLVAHVREIVEGQRSFVEERGFTLVAPNEDAPVRALFDEQAVDQIVVNLLDNAVKYGGGDEHAIEVGVEDGPPAIVVRDRGPGIPERERVRVFERFHRVEREEQRHAPGTGIGLALVAELAAAHGGAASVHPRDGGGLEVRVTLARYS